MDILEVVECDNREDEWNDFVARSNNGTIFHNLDFLSYHHKDKFNVHNLMFYRGSSTSGGKLLGVMPMALFDEDGEVAAKSPYGASFGGVVAENYRSFEDSEHIITCLIDYLRNAGAACLYLRTPPYIYYEVPESYIEYNLVLHGATMARREITSIIDLASFESDPFDIYISRGRTVIRKAQKSGIVIREANNNIEIFYQILLETLGAHDAVPTHTLDELIKLMETLPNSFKLDIAYIGDEPIAGVLTFICNKRVVLDFYNCQKPEYRSYSPVSLLLHNVLLWAKQKGFKYFDLGTSASTASKQPNYGLLRFKESLGATGIFRDTYKLSL